MEENTPKTNKVKPKLRGVSHQWAAIVSIFFGAWLVMETPNEEVRWIASIYALSLTLLLGVSAIYHRVHWTPERRAWMRRLDHTMIFVLIAGSYTPVCILGLEGAIADWMLKIVWGSVVVGAIYNLIWLHAPKWIMAVLCSVVGLTAVVALGDMWEQLGPAFVIWILAGGLCYTIGAVTYATRKPDPVPTVFGYHEVFHALVIAAAACHYVAFKLYIFDPLASA